MAISGALDQLRSQFADCLIVSFADVSTGMVLSASSGPKVHQEHLDALSATATEMLTGATSRRIAQALSDASSPEISQAVILNPTEIGVFLRAPEGGSDALFCACAPGIALDAFVAGARETFAGILSSFSDQDSA